MQLISQEYPHALTYIYLYIIFSIQEDQLPTAKKVQRNLKSGSYYLCSYEWPTFQNLPRW